MAAWQSHAKPVPTHPTLVSSRAPAHGAVLLKQGSASQDARENVLVGVPLRARTLFLAALQLIFGGLAHGRDHLFSGVPQSWLVTLLAGPN